MLRSILNMIGIVLFLGTLFAWNHIQTENTWPVHPGRNGTVVDKAALELLLTHADETNTSAIAIAIDGRLLAVRGSDVPMSAMSASKSIASLAVGLLIDDGAMTLDSPAADWVPEWRESKHALITIRHILNHTSGLDPTRADIRTGNIREHGTKSRLLFEPGSRFQYNNNAVDFLAVIVERAAGKPMDRLIEERLFSPLMIRDAVWLKDTEGVPFAAGELEIRPTSLLVIGQLLADRGVWQGERLISEEWIATSISVSQGYMPTYGLLWWREGEFLLSLTQNILDQWRAADIPDNILIQVRSLLGRTFRNYKEFQELMVGQLGEKGFESWRDWLRSSRGVTWAEQIEVGPQIGFSARGWLGQFLVILPETRTVAVRMRRPDKDDFSGGPEKNAFSSFPAEVAAIASK